MSARVNITLSPESKAYIESLEKMPADMPRVIARVMDKQNNLTVAYIQRTYLSFPKDGPPQLNGLRVQSNRLRGSIRASKAVITGAGISSAIGSNVKYAALHEFGGKFTRTQKPGVVRLRADAGGNLLRQDISPNLAVFAARRHKRVVEVQHEGSTYTVTYPERMPVRRGINDRMGAYRDAIGTAIVKMPGGAK